MITTYSGANSFGLHEELNKRTAKFSAEHGDLALERVDGEEADFARLREAVTGLPFLASKKLVVLRAPSAQKQWMEKAEQILADAPETNEIVIVEPKVDKRSVYYKFLKKNTDFKEFNEPDENGLAAWLVRSAKDRGGAISSNDARYLVSRIGLNQQLLSNELDKLLLYDPNVNRRSIDLLTVETPQSTIFQLIESAFHGQTARALQLYSEQRALKVEPQQIIAMLGWQLHVLAVLKAAGDRPVEEVARQSKLSPYVLKKSQSVARALPVAKLKQLVSSLADIDLRSKRQALDLDDALQHFILTIA